MEKAKKAVDEDDTKREIIEDYHNCASQVYAGKIEKNLIFV